MSRFVPILSKYKCAESCGFQPRTYGKTGLTLFYLPYSSPETAPKTLTRWINECPMLLSEMESIRYNAHRHTLLKSEVEAIIKHLGDAIRAFP